jgi:hypothetical protein
MSQGFGRGLDVGKGMKKEFFSNKKSRRNDWLSRVERKRRGKGGKVEASQVQHTTQLNPTLFPRSSKN